MSPRLDALVDPCARGALLPNVALMQMMMAAGGEGEVACALQSAAALENGNDRLNEIAILNRALLHW